MGFTYLLCIALAALSLARPNPPLADGREDPPGRASFGILARAFALVCAYALQLALAEQRQHVPTFLPVLSDRCVALASDGVFLAETLLLFALAAAAGTMSRAARLGTGVASAAMFGLSLHFKNAGGDLTAYVASTLERDPYQPAAHALPPRFALLNHIWGVPTVPSTYGPLWNLVARLAAQPFATLDGKMLAMQMLGAAALVAIVVTLARTQAPPVVVALVALNPFLWSTYVAEAHNDLFAAAFAVIAARSVRGRTIVAAIVAAAATKASFAVTALATLARLRSRRDRVRGALCAVACTAFIVALIGPEYPLAIRHGLAIYAYPLPSGDVLLRTLAEACAVAFAGYAVVSGRVPWGSGWVAIALGQFPLTNYVVWGLPTAIVGRAATIFLASLPYAAFETNNVLVETTPFALVRLAAATGVCVALALALRRRGRAFAREVRARAV